MDLTVSAVQDHHGRAAFHGRDFRCAIGRTGIAAAKTEGDGASPAGRFRLVQVLYDGWCDDPAHADYNRAVSLPHPARCETLWRDDGLYDIVVITDHNSDPVVAGDGSGIFVHVAGGADYPPTRGCIAFTQDDLERILKDWDPAEDRLGIAGT